jgi:nitrate/nitrite transporter NarK
MYVSFHGSIADLSTGFLVPSYRIVPYINPTYTGALSGIIGSGGNVGGVVFGLCFQQMDFKHAYLTMGCLIMLSSLLSVFVFIKGQAGLVWRTSIVTEESCKSTLADGSASKQEGKSPVLSKESEETASDASV